ncbi:hypothetical protein U1Q18_003301 [Sarracenia purpurea var. burkii]
MASFEARIRSLKGLSPVIKEAKNATAEEKLIKKEVDEQEISPGFRSSPREINVGATVQGDSCGKIKNVVSDEEKEDRLFLTIQGLTPSVGVCEIRNEKGAEFAESDLARKLLYKSNVGAREPNRNIDAVPYGEKSGEDDLVDDVEALLSNEADPEKKHCLPSWKKKVMDLDPQASKIDDSRVGTENPWGNVDISTFSISTIESSHLDEVEETFSAFEMNGDNRDVGPLFVLGDCIWFSFD